VTGRHTDYRNRSTHSSVRLLGTAIGLASTAHGVFEVRQGNKATDGRLLTDIGAFTLVPNYRATGVAAIATGLTLAGWTLAGIRSRSGPPVFLLLSALSFLLGGGIAQVSASLSGWSCCRPASVAGSAVRTTSCGRASPAVSPCWSPRSPADSPETST